MRGVKNPRRRIDDNTLIALNANKLSVTAIEDLMNFDICAEIRVPTIMNPINLPDMGRMNGNWASAAGTGYSQGPIPAEKPWRAL